MDVFPFACGFAILGVCPALLFAFRFDEFLQSIYSQDREGWEKLGKPRGYFWIPDGSCGLSPGIDKINWANGLPDALLSRIRDGHIQFEKLRKLKWISTVAMLVGVLIAVLLIVIQHKVREVVPNNVIQKTEAGTDEKTKN